MRRVRREESGFALVVVLMLMLISLGIAFAIVSRADSQSAMSADERTKESSFHLAEAALNAEGVQLSRTWPTASYSATAPTSCDPTSTSTMCPQASAIGGGYSTSDYASSCRSAATPPPLWQTQVRDNAPTGGTAERYWTTAVSSASRAAYDLNGDGILWVRATASVMCKRVSIVALVSRTLTQMDFPQSVVSANFFQTSNQGKKVIVDTLGAYAQPPSIRPTTAAAQPSPVTVRCSGVPSGSCLSYPTNKGQIQPPATQVSSSGNTSALSQSQLQSLERQALAAGTYFPNTGACPSVSQLSSVGGAPVVVQGPCAISVGSNSMVNSPTNPGVLVIENGTFTLSGTASFYGLLYMVNKQNATYPTILVDIQGNAFIQGSIAVDGGGGVRAGSSKTNIIFDPRAPTLLRGDSGAAVNKNTFRVLPASTP